MDDLSENNVEEKEPNEPSTSRNLDFEEKDSSGQHRFWCQKIFF